MEISGTYSTPANRHSKLTTTPECHSSCGRGKKTSCLKFTVDLSGGMQVCWLAYVLSDVPSWPLVRWFQHKFFVINRDQAYTCSWYYSKSMQSMTTRRQGEQKKYVRGQDDTAPFGTTFSNAQQIIPKDPRHPTVPQSYSHLYPFRCTAPPEAVGLAGSSCPPNHVVNRHARYQPVSSQEATSIS